MGEIEERRERWFKYKAATQAELSAILTELERLGLDQRAAKIRPLAMSPENYFGSAGDWQGGIMNAGNEFESAADIPEELRRRLHQLVIEIPFSGR